MSKKIRLPMHPRNFGSHMTIGPPARPPIRPQHRHANVKKLKQQVWQPKCNSRFYLAGKRMAAGLLERKNNNKVVSFSTLFLMCTLTRVTEKELERVIADKGDEFHCKKKMKMS